MTGASASRRRFPSLLEELDASARARMFPALVVVERQAEARTIGRHEAAVGVIDPRRIVDEGVRPLIREVVEVLEDLVVGRRDRKVKIRHRPDRTADVVRREHERIRRRPAGELLHRDEAAEVRQVDLDDVDEAAAR